MKDLVIFDLDGTLLDTVADLAESVNYALHTCGFPEHRQEEYKLFVGNGISKLFERALPEGAKTAENIERIRREFIPYYNSHCRELTKPYESVPEMLLQLQKDDVLLSVASNKYDSAVQELVSYYFPQIRFEIISGSREGVPAKPDPAMVRNILAATGVSEDNTLFVGDSAVDMETALNAGVKAVGVTWGFREKAELEQYSPAYVIDAPLELLRIVEH